MVQIGLAALISLSDRVVGRRDDSNHGEVRDQEIVFQKFPDNVLLGDLWSKLRNGDHTWPPYAISSRGGVTGVDFHNKIKFAAFARGEILPPLTLLSSVRNATFDNDSTGSKSQSLTRDRTLELASIDFWLSQAAQAPSLRGGRVNIESNAPAVVEEIWLEFHEDIMDLVESKWDLNGGDRMIQRLTEDISLYLQRFLKPPQEYFAWVAFLRAAKVLQCFCQGPDTAGLAGILQEDKLVYLL